MSLSCGNISPNKPSAVYYKSIQGSKWLRGLRLGVNILNQKKERNDHKGDNWAWVYAAWSQGHTSEINRLLCAKCTWSECLTFPNWPWQNISEKLFECRGHMESMFPSHLFLNARFLAWLHALSEQRTLQVFACFIISSTKSAYISTIRLKKNTVSDSGALTWIQRESQIWRLRTVFRQ